MSSFEKTSHDPFYRRFYQRLTRNKGKDEKVKEITSYWEKPIHVFKWYPYYLWVASGMWWPVSVILTYYLYQLSLSQGYFAAFVNIIMYYIGFYLLYIGNIEWLTINRKKWIFGLKKINIFGTKRERNYNFEDVDFIEIVIKGIKRGADDHRKYFIRINLKDKDWKPICFGYTWSFDVIKLKYQICLAMIKGMIIATVKDYLITNESEYWDVVY